MTMRARRVKRALTSLLVLIAAICIVAVLSMTVIRWVDQVVCVSSVARRLGVPATYAGIESYILEAATPGMTREETMEVFSRLGPSRVAFRDRVPSSHETRDTIFTRICLHPLNNLQIFAFFDSADRLVSTALLNND